ncbi:DUF3311 domain-containing protein [Actinophytocola sp.]|uniref:DUF3311 domain-containing protein n=1 Tax=Actinophytocola sp. TaxID=1872138 RepID=UPI002D7ECAEA|nr:DUF3311 domain-containing protein [Actinophytocola sp.]HET9142470.1 DUF3311 domain-containing protein [Actinophytocola sp.]
MASTQVPDGGRAGLRWNAWNLLLLVPLLWLLTPLFNQQGPELFGMPFFYWFQFAGIAVGVAATTVVYLKTRRAPAGPDTPDRLDVDDLDEGAAR